jgi:cellulose 1,4-beta-cellobiosidase
MLAILGMSLVSAAAAQQAGSVTPESHPPITVKRCSKAGGCVEETTALVLDSQWRWLHDMNGYTNCMSDETGAWDSALCPDPATCTQGCGVEGLALKDYEETYGIAAVDGGVKLKYVPGSRVYLLDGSSQYKMFKLLNREVSIDVDLSSLPCGTNAAAYFVEMPADGGPGAGARYGAGYCDAQCPQGMKFVDGAANMLEWGTVQKKTPWGELKEVGPQGKYGACCAEMDLLEANRVASAYTAHPCATQGTLACSSAQDCGDSDLGEVGVCDKAGCGFNSYRMGDRKFYGPGPEFKVDTTKVMTLVTQFVTADGTDTGDLVEIRRLWIQDGKVIENSRAPLLPNSAGGRSLTDDMCRTSAQVFNASMDSFTALGGLRAMGDAIGRGMVLTLSVWDDPFSNMLWLDGQAQSPREDKTKPGVMRGPCAFSPYTKAQREQSADASVTFTNIKYGEIGSTVLNRRPSPAAATAVPAAPPAGATQPPVAAPLGGARTSSASATTAADGRRRGSCCLAASDIADFCGTCHPTAWAGHKSWCDESYTNCHNCTGHAVAWCEGANMKNGDVIFADMDSLGGVQMKDSAAIAGPTAPWRNSPSASSALLASASAVSAVIAAFIAFRRLRSGYGQLPEAVSVPAPPEAF